MTDKLLDHVHSITLHRDTALLDRSVITSLLQLLKLADASLYEICKLDGELFVTKTAWSENGKVFGQEHLTPESETLPLEGFPDIRAAVEGEQETFIEDGLHRHYVPVCAEEGPIACFDLRHTEGLDAHQIDLAAGIIGLYRNYRALLEDSQQDTLTGLNNRKTFDRSLAGLLAANALPDDESAADGNPEPHGDVSIERRQSNTTEHWLAVIDIDHFKRVNDRFGHLYGDEVLILVANRMRRCFRQSDKLFRFGGEEFVVLLRHVSATNALATLERFRAEIAREPFPQVGTVTVSIGLAEARQGDTPAAVLGNADEALYFAKGNGRNQVHRYETLIEQGLLTRKALHTEVEFF